MPNVVCTLQAVAEDLMTIINEQADKHQQETGCTDAQRDLFKLQMISCISRSMMNSYMPKGE
jgi:hypothetical protein